MLNVWVVNFKLSLHDELQDEKGREELLVFNSSWT